MTKEGQELIDAALELLGEARRLNFALEATRAFDGAGFSEQVERRACYAIEDFKASDAAP